MENFTSFLESSTIHGLAYLATASRKLVKLFWLIVVTAGFIGAGILIFKSFKDWNENPITTTIETLPIENVTFPKVTVCPPKNTYTDLNYDLLRTEGMKLSEDTRKELTTYAMDLLRENMHNSTVPNLNLLRDDDRYYNWYYGYTQMTFPKSDSKNRISYTVSTSAMSGSISTLHFGEKFDPSKVEKNIFYKIEIDPPDAVHCGGWGQNNCPSGELHVEIDRVAMKDLPSGDDDFVHEGFESQNHQKGVPSPYYLKT